jgi:acyl transferase domain-containing protein
MAMMDEATTAESRGRGLVFLFPGQGSFDAALLHELYISHQETAPWFVAADAIARRYLGLPFLPLAAEPSPERRRELVAAAPELTQVGIFLTSVATARLLETQGIVPDLLLGHSFGELASLGAAEAFDLESGLEIVCQRVLALREVGGTGGIGGIGGIGAMAALSVGPERTQELLELLADPASHALEIAVLNHPRQTVVSGSRRDLESLAAVAAQNGVTLTFLDSAYPFHSSHLIGAVDRFATGLETYAFAAPRVPVHLATAGRRWTADLDLPALLAWQLTRRLDFAGAVKELYAEGYRRFLEVGAGDRLGKLVARNLAAAGEKVQVFRLLAPGEGLRQGLARLGETPELAGDPALAPSTARERELARLLGEAAARIDRAERLLRAPARARMETTETAAAPVDPEPAPEPCPVPPMAIVAMGAVLPGAADPEELWRNVLAGVSGIVDLAALDPEIGQDFVAGSGNGHGPVEVVPDKSYTMLNGAVPKIPYDARLLSWFYDEAGFAALTRGQKLLARALAQTLAALPAVGRANGRIQCLLGATADGSNEYDEARFRESVRRALEDLDLPPARRSAFAARLDRLPGFHPGDSENLGQHALYRAVVDRMLGDGVPTVVVDAACSSSLYSLSLGVAALAQGAADLVLAGGVFAPGPANNALFAQFRGLTPHASRPFDAAADGVVFGDGAAVVALKRLPDALAAGDRVLGVIRAIGLSSDGKSASINVPQAAGQSLAIRRAYRASGIALDTIQVVEAHATATPVGDAVELRSLAQVFAERSAGLPRIQLGSVKALLGHTGWVSGVASLIKMVQAMAARTVPPQYNFSAPHPDLDLAASPFEIAREALPWPANLAPYPRRASINGFGFGGTNAHLVVEEFDEPYHRRLCRGLAAPAAPMPIPRPALAVVGVASLFPRDPADTELAAAAPGPARRFARQALRLPAGKRLLPDVTEHMDASQYLAALAAEQLFARLPKALLERPELRQEIGVVVGFSGKTERGVRANERIFLDRLRRLVTAAAPAGERRADEEILAALRARLHERTLPSGPYTLPGLMPNVAASRVVSLFDLKGPNLVVDKGEGSLCEALSVAADLLARGDCRVVLAGGLNAATGERTEEANEAEGVLMLALASPETARELGLATLALLADAPDGAAAVAIGGGAPDGLCWRGAQGATEILAALARAGEGSAASVGDRQGRRLAFAPPPGVAPAPATMPPAVSPASPEEPSSTHAYVQGTPIETYAPVLVAAPPAAPAVPAGWLAGRRLLVLTDQPELWASVARSGALAGASATVACPAEAAASAIPGALALDLASEAGLAAAAAAISQVDFDTILALKRPGGARSLLLRPLAAEARLLDLLFVACQQAYPRLARGEVALYGLVLDAFADGRLQAWTGLLGGFMKSLARELPAAAVLAVHSDTADPARAVAQLALEIGQPRAGNAGTEVCWLGDHRQVFALAPLSDLAVDREPCLDASSVVLATAGGRGVTAVLAEELLCRFGCTVIAVGRTDPHALPPALAALSEADLAASEGRFYKEELARDPGQRIPDLKRRFAGYLAAAELKESIARLSALPGRFEYHPLDLHDEAAVARLVAALHDRHGRLDLVLHGAGIQISKVLPKKPLADFRRIVTTKLGGLSAIYRACLRHAAGRPVHFHLVSSAFSYLGNDGQPDYGAANEAMNRLAAALDGADGGASWSSLAWLGWAGIGMTRGSEFAALAASRRLRGVTHDEGREIFGRLMAGRPTPVTVLLAQGERDFYRPALVAADALPAPQASPTPRPARERATALVVPVEIDLERAPFLFDHQVHGVPTLPGAYLLSLAADAARRLRPDLAIVAFEDTSFRRFVRVYPGRRTELRLDTRIVAEDEVGARVRVQILSDFVHKSGLVLEKDIVQTEIFLRMEVTPAGAPPQNGDAPLAAGRELPDPYLLEGSPVRLNGRFKSLRNLAVDAEKRRASYQLGNLGGPASPLESQLPNVVLVDAFWRFGTVMATGERTLSVYVPERCDRMGVYFDYNDADLSWLKEPVVFTGANPRPEGDQLLVGPIEARDREGRVRLTVEGGVCRKFGEIHDAF